LGSPPAKVTDPAITRDRVVFVAAGCVALAPHAGSSDLEWIATGVVAPIPVYALTPSLERWSLRTAPMTVHREVLDPTPQRFAHTSERPVDMSPRHLWTTDGRMLDRHDLVDSSCNRRIFPPGCKPGDFVFVANATRSVDTDGGWLVGLVQHQPMLETELVVLDAADIARPAIATIRLPSGIPSGQRSTWIPDRTITHHEG